MESTLTKTESLVLECLQRSPGIVRIETIYQYVKPQGIAYFADNTIRAHISNIRNKLGFEVIKTHRGIGYSLSTKRICPTCKQPYGVLNE